jgi:hypothetical protein
VRWIYLLHIWLGFNISSNTYLLPIDH